MKTETKDMILAMQAEFDEKDGFVTCEFAIKEESIPEFKEFVKTNSDKQSKLGIWVICTCGTCVEYHGPNYHHCELARLEHAIEVCKCSNFIDWA